MKKSIDILEKVSDELNRHTVFYKFNKNIEASDKYKKGRIDASTWLNELVYYYIKKEKNFIAEFKEEINKQKNKINSVKNGDYKMGLIDELKTIEDSIDDRNNK